MTGQLTYPPHLKYNNTFNVAFQKDTQIKRHLHVRTLVCKEIFMSQRKNTYMIYVYSLNLSNLKDKCSEKAYGRPFKRSPIVFQRSQSLDHDLIGPSLIDCRTFSLRCTRLKKQTDECEYKSTGKSYRTQRDHATSLATCYQYRHGDTNHQVCARWARCKSMVYIGLLYTQGYHVNIKL